MATKAIGFIFSLPLLMLGVAACISAWQIATFARAPMDFTVESSHMECEQPLNNRCVRHYDVINGDGRARDLVPFGFEFESGALEVGKRIEKAPYSLTYQIDGQFETWPFLWQHVSVCVLGAIGLVVWFQLHGPAMFNAWMRQKRWP
jgi:hypothetical protein